MWISEFQPKKDYIVRPCLQKKKKKIRESCNLSRLFIGQKVNMERSNSILLMWCTFIISKETN